MCYQTPFARSRWSAMGIYRVPLGIYVGWLIWLVPFHREWSNLAWQPTWRKACLCWFSNVLVSTGGAPALQLFWTPYLFPRRFTSNWIRRSNTYRTESVLMALATLMHFFAQLRCNVCQGQLSFLFNYLACIKMIQAKSNANLNSNPYSSFVKYCRSPFLLLCCWVFVFTHCCSVTLLSVLHCTGHINTVCSQDELYWFLI